MRDAGLGQRQGGGKGAEPRKRQQLSYLLPAALPPSGSLGRLPQLLLPLLASQIDEYLETGFIAKLEEYRATGGV